ncbi:MAG: urea amidolyase associated protein UAAP1 [Rhodomicrobium sp.]
MTEHLTNEHSEIVARRKRYDELMATAQRDATKVLPPLTGLPGPTIAADAIVSRSRVPGGWYWSGRLLRGHSIRILNLTGTSSVSFLTWNCHDPSERFNHADTVKLQWTAALRRGRLILSDMGRVLMSIAEDTCGAHDVLVGGSTAESTEHKYGGGHRNTRDNFVLMASKFGLDRRDIPPCVTFFAPVFTDNDGRLLWGHDRRKEGDFIELRAEIDVLVALSNCPHPLDPAPTFQAVPSRL